MKTKSSIGKTAASLVAGGALAASLYANAVYVPQQERTLEENLQSELASILAGESELVSSGDGFTVTEAVKAAEVLAVEEKISQTVSVEGAVVTVASVEQEVVSAYTDAVEIVAQNPPPQTTRPPEDKLDPDGNDLRTGEAFGPLAPVLGFGANFGVGKIGAILSSPLANSGTGGAGLPGVAGAVGSNPAGAPLVSNSGSGGVNAGGGNSSTSGDAVGSGAGLAGAAATGAAAGGAGAGNGVGSMSVTAP